MNQMSPIRAVAAPLRIGQWVEVKSFAEIARTLDAKGELDGMPFMPEMAAFCGQRLRVARRLLRPAAAGRRRLPKRRPL
jgi:hypothetical protein